MKERRDRSFRSSAARQGNRKRDSVRNLAFMLPESVGFALVIRVYLSNKRRFGDVQDNALYWNFVVLTWLPIYGAIHWIPRL
jgi:hypothetical protein